MSEKKEINEEDIKKVSGGETNQTFQEIVEASRNWLPVGDVTCEYCGKSFNAKDNAYGFTHVTHQNGMTETRAVSRCPSCGIFWTVK